MTDARPLAERRFTMEDQLRFAALSADVNPMHLDPLAARRTPAGVPVAHGMNVLMWAVDGWCAAHRDTAITAIAAEFKRFVAVGEMITLSAKTVRVGTRLEVHNDDSRLIAITLRHGAALGACDSPQEAGDPPPSAEKAAARLHSPSRLDFAEASEAHGAIALQRWDASYPDAAARIGLARMSALAGLSYLVGMAAPGLHSIFSRFDVAIVPQPERGAMAYRVAKSHDVLRLVELAVSGNGIAGTVTAFVRLPPVVQPSLAHLRAMVATGSYAKVAALIVGGSRGLGEVTAKLLGAGGARVAISYAVGQADAEAVAQELRAAGCACDTLRIDVRRPIEPQLAALNFMPNQLYYYATAKIFLQKAGIYSPAVFADFQRIYVDGFAEICAALSRRDAGGVRAFYPSSVAIEQRPRAMTEYTMAKAAAEILCADIDRFMPRVTVVSRRLPRLLTDQTATVTPMLTPSAEAVMAEAVAAMMAK